MQFTSNAYFSMAYPNIKKPSIWKLWNLDYIIEQGDILFKSVGIGQALVVNQLPINFKIENFDLNGVMLHHESHLMQDKNELFEDYRHLTQRNTGEGAIFKCAGFSAAILWNKTSLFLLGIIKQCTHPYSPAPTPTHPLHPHSTKILSHQSPPPQNNAPTTLNNPK